MATVAEIKYRPKEGKMVLNVNADVFGWLRKDKNEMSGQATVKDPTEPERGGCSPIKLVSLVTVFRDGAIMML